MMRMQYATNSLGKVISGHSHRTPGPSLSTGRTVACRAQRSARRKIVVSNSSTISEREVVNRILNGGGNGEGKPIGKAKCEEEGVHPKLFILPSRH